jgi:hypothetical protein
MEKEIVRHWLEVPIETTGKASGKVKRVDKQAGAYTRPLLGST